MEFTGLSHTDTSRMPDGLRETEKETNVMGTIHSNLTDHMVSAVSDWYQTMLEASRKNLPADRRNCAENLELEDILNSPSTYALMQQLKPVSFFRFLVYYLVHQHAEDLSGAGYAADSREERLRCIEEICSVMKPVGLAGRSQKEADAVRRSRRMRDYLVERMMEDMVRNHIAQRNTEPNGKITYLVPVDLQDDCHKKRLSLHACRTTFFADRISDDLFFVLALGLQMTLADVEIFLKKALRRTGIDFWNITEVAVYLCLTCRIEQKLQFCVELRKRYKAMDCVDGEQQTLQNAVPWTQVLADRARQLVTSMGNHRLTADAEELTAFLTQYKAITAGEGTYTHSRTKCFLRLKDQLEKNMETIGRYSQNASSLVGEPQASVINGHAAEGMIQVYYPTDTSVCIPKGTVFTGMLAGKQEKKTVRFFSTREICSPDKEAFVTVKVPVEGEETVCHRDKKQDIGYLPRGTSGCTCDGFPEVWIEIGSTFKANGRISETTRIRGNMTVHCPRTINIPRGTIFRAPNGNVYHSLQDITNVYDMGGTSCFCLDVPVRGEGEMDAAKKHTDFTIEGRLEQKEAIVAVHNRQKIGRIGKQIAAEEKKYRLCVLLYEMDPMFHPIEEKDFLFGQQDPAVCMQIFGSILAGHKLNDTFFSKLHHHTAEVDRDKLLTIAFLAEMSKKELPFGLEQEDMEEQLTPREQLLDVMQSVSDVLTQCGFYEVYLPNPYETLMLSLCTCDEPLQLYRSLWSRYAYYLEDKHGAG